MASRRHAASRRVRDGSPGAPAGGASVAAMAALLLCVLAVGCDKFPGWTSAPAKDGEGAGEAPPPAASVPADEAKGAAAGARPRPAPKPKPKPKPKPLPVPVNTGPDGLDDVLSRAEKLERETRFSEALKLCRGARTTYARHPRAKELKRLMARLMEERKVALNLPFAVENLGSERAEEVMVAKDALAGAGEVGRLFLRKAVRDREGPIAAEAAKLLAEVRDDGVAALMLARLQNDLKDPPRSALLASMKRLFVAGRGLEVLPELDGFTKGDDEFAFRDVAAVLCSVFGRTAKRDAARYGKLVGDPGGHARLKAYFERAMISGDKALAAWALEHGAALGLVPGLVVWYKFDGDAQDSSGNDYHATPRGAPTWETGHIGTGSVGCRSGCIVLPDIRKEFTNQATLALWIKMDSAEVRGQGIFHFGVAGGTMTHYIHDVRFYLKAFRNDRHSFTAPATPDRATWHHIAVTNAPGGGNWKVYMNGAEVNSTTGEDTITLPPNCFIGSGEPAGTSRPGANFDDVQVYNRALTPAEIGVLAGPQQSERKGGGAVF